MIRRKLGSVINQMKAILLILFNVVSIISFGQGREWKFDFGPGKIQPGYTQVLPGTAYTSERGYGFEFNTDLSYKSYTGKDPLRDDYITSAKPFYFSIRLPEGNYNVKVILGDKEGSSLTTIKAECRRLMVEKVETVKGKFTTCEFTVHIRDSIIRPANTKVRLKPREFIYLHWDDKLTLEFNNLAAKVCGVEIKPAENIPTVFLAGNSTVVDQAEEPWAAWGQMIPAFFQGGKIAIANYAESGETLKAFKGERRLDKVWSMIRPGDYLFIEFAHNDQKPGSSHLDPFTTYKQTLKEWIAEARKRGVTPILVTSMNRRTFDSSGHITNSLGDYPEAMRQTAKEENVVVIDLNAMSKTLYEAWGPTKSVKAFVYFAANTYPNQPKDVKDDTHFSPYGAYELSKCIVEGIKEKIPGLASYLKKGLPAFDPAHPDPFEKWMLPPSLFVGTIKPDGN
jgi:lysophospholipase L1-like esterase